MQNNLIRQLRNESAYQLLRNGFFTLLLALSLSVVILTVKQQSNPVKKAEVQPVIGQAKQVPKHVKEKIDNQEELKDKAGVSPGKKVFLNPEPENSEATEKTSDSKNPATTNKRINALTSFARSNIQAFKSHSNRLPVSFRCVKHTR